MKKSSKTDSISLCGVTKDDTDINNDNSNIYIKYFYWGPNDSIIKIIEQICIRNKNEKVLEIGPGKVPFKFATDFVGCNEDVKKYIDIDIDKDKIPFDNNYFDFIFCRHVLEDIQNPDFALTEILRVSKSGGYIETPSPLIEITKNVDANFSSDLYCGYIHHRYIVWSNIQKNEIYFLPKYSCILDHMLVITNETNKYKYNIINNYPVYWNNYFIFTDSKPNIIMYKNGVNFNKKKNTMVEDYIALVNRAVNESIQNTNYFIENYKSLLI
jgi:SAM-dependent methyltransferase